MTKKGTFYRFEPEMTLRIAAWSLILKKDKTAIMEEAFKSWEQNQSEEEKTKVENIIKVLK
ncbi:MAG: hypothetical protein Q8911_00045 [Bacillota bacterium]|nr:hypothetical protein [Bacillota bacterium]